MSTELGISIWRAWSSLFLDLFVFILCLCVFCLHVSVYTTYVPGACKGPKRALESLDLGLQMVMIMSQHVSAGNGIPQVLCKSSSTLNLGALSSALRNPLFLRKRKTVEKNMIDLSSCRIVRSWCWFSEVPSYAAMAWTGSRFWINISLNIYVNFRNPKQILCPLKRTS